MGSTNQIKRRRIVKEKTVVEAPAKINYRKCSDEVRKAWFTYIREFPNPSASPVIFVAGWNAAMNKDKE
jgi:hypothetical protein